MRTVPRTLAVSLVSIAAATCALSIALAAAWRALPGAAAQEAGKPAAPPAVEELEKKFRETLDNVSLVGKWRLVKDGVLGEEREERYTIHGVSKVGKLWFVQARIQYGDKDVTLPVPVNVDWAGDTPIISITDAGLPGLGTYSARVMFTGGLYTGIWSGKGYGGFLSGRIEKNPPVAETEKKKDA